jgi:hypothetical protein
MEPQSTPETGSDRDQTWVRPQGINIHEIQRGRGNNGILVDISPIEAPHAKSCNSRPNSGL